MTTPYERLASKCAALEHELEKAREEIKFLRRQVNVQAETSVVDTLARMFKLTLQEAALLGALYEARGRTLSKWALEESLPKGDIMRDRDIKIVDVVVCKLRRKVGAAAIDTLWGRGYGISAVGLERINAALAGDAVFEPDERGPARVRMERSRKIARYVFEHPGSSSREVALAIGVPTYHVKATLNRAKTDGRARNWPLGRGMHGGNPPVAWALTEEGERYYGLKAAA